MKQRYQFYVSLNEILSVKSFGLTLFDITATVELSGLVTIDAPPPHLITNEHVSVAWYTKKIIKGDNNEYKNCYK